MPRQRVYCLTRHDCILAHHVGQHIAIAIEGGKLERKKLILPVAGGIVCGKGLKLTHSLQSGARECEGQDRITHRLRFSGDTCPQILIQHFGSKVAF